jgi:hypothetical protein
MTDAGFDVAYEYTVRFYPRWFTWAQINLTQENSERQGSGSRILNRLAGPLGMGPEYKIVVAINDDTIYAQAFLDLSKGPVLFTIPPYQHTYSILLLDVYGNVLSTALSESPLPTNGATYAFVLANSNYSGTLPSDAIPVEVEFSSTEMAIRIDKHSSTGEDLILAANEFRAGLALGAYNSSDPNAPLAKTLLTPLFLYAPSVKLMADEGLATSPEAFLTTLQEAMASPTTSLGGDDQELIDRFNARFDAAKKAVVDDDSRPLTDILRGAQAAHAAIINRWQSHRGPTNWIHFDNIGQWGKKYLDRAALTEYIQCGNDQAAAYYANAFVDGSGVPLDGGSFGYTITFAASEIPQCTRFWSMTAYTPGAVELVPNVLDKYVVASYTRGLVTAEDGSVTIYVRAEPPEPTHLPNWLPVPKGPFSLLFRIYGPEGAARDGSYVMPKIHRTIAH